MRTVYAKHFPYDDDHLGVVIDEMKLTGAPTIRVIEFEDKLFAIEGSHRLAAAHHLELEPKLVIMEEDVEGLEESWRKVAKTLPTWSYTFAHGLDLRKIAANKKKSKYEKWFGNPQTHDMGH